jgi:hypothetical protein
VISYAVITILNLLQNLNMIQYSADIRPEMGNLVKQEIGKIRICAISDFRNFRLTVCCRVPGYIVRMLQKVKLLVIISDVVTRLGQAVSGKIVAMQNTDPTPLNPLAAWTRAVLMYPAQVCSDRLNGDGSSG